MLELWYQDKNLKNQEIQTQIKIFDRLMEFFVKYIKEEMPQAKIIIALRDQEKTNESSITEEEYFDNYLNKFNVKYAYNYH